MTRAAPCCSRQSVNPPVDAPTSRQTSPSTSIFQWSRARSSFNPPRLTYFRSSPSRRIAQSAVTCAPAFSIFCSFDKNFSGKDQRLRPLARRRPDRGPREVCRVVTFTMPFERTDLALQFYHESASTRLRCKVLKHLVSEPLTSTAPALFHSIFHERVENFGPTECRATQENARNKKSRPTAGGFVNFEVQKTIPQLLPAASDRCRSSRARSARRHALRALPSGGSWCWRLRLPA